MSIYPLVNPDRYGPNLGHASSAGSAQARAFKKLEQFLEKNPNSANQEYKQTFFFEDLSICFQCILTTPEDKEVRPLHAMFLFNFGYPLSGADFVEGVKLLVQYKADVNHVYRDLKPIHSIMYRRFKGTSRVIELLLSNGANINDKNSAGSTPLHILVGRKELWRFTTEGLSSDGKESISSLLKLILRKGALINAQDNKGKTPLHLAVEAQDDEAILVLLSNNCNTSLVNEGNQTPLELAKTLHQCNTVIMAMLENPDAFVKPAEKVEVEVGVEGTNQV